MSKETKNEVKQELNEEELKKITGGKGAPANPGLYSSASSGIPYSQQTQNSANNAHNSST